MLVIDVNITGYTCTELDICKYYYVSSYENDKNITNWLCNFTQADDDEWQHI